MWLFFAENFTNAKIFYNKLRIMSISSTENFCNAEIFYTKLHQRKSLYTKLHKLYKTSPTRSFFHKRISIMQLFMSKTLSRGRFLQKTSPGELFVQETSPTRKYSIEKFTNEKIFYRKLHEREEFVQKTSPER